MNIKYDFFFKFGEFQATIILEFMELSTHKSLE